MFAVQISIPYQYTSFWGSGIPIYLMFSENSSNIPIYRMHDLGAQKGQTNIPHVFEKWPNIPIYLNLTSTRKLLQAHCYIGIYPTVRGRNFPSDVGKLGPASGVVLVGLASGVPDRDERNGLAGLRDMARIVRYVTGTWESRFTGRILLLVQC